MAYKINAGGSVSLDTGEKVRISISRQRLPNGSGVSFTASAVWVDETGNAKLDDDGKVDSSISFTADTMSIEKYGEAVLARELLLVLLGEPPSLEAILLSDACRGNANIRQAIAMAKPGALDPIGLLG